MAKHSTTKWIAGLVVIGIIAYVIYENPDLLERDVTSGTQPTTSSSDFDKPQASTIQTYVGTLTQRVDAYDSEDPTIQYGEDTETTSIFFKKVGDTYSQMSGTAGSAIPYTATLQIDESVSTVYAEVSIKSGQAYYVDSAKTISSNARLGTPQWLDLSADGRKTYVFPVDVTGYNPDPNNTPTQTMTVFLIDEGSIDVDSPANIVISSDGRQRCNIKWSADMDNAGDGEAVWRIRITTNSTDITEWDANESNISWPTGRYPNSATDKIYLNEFVPTQLASTYQYDYTFGNGDVNDAHFLISPKNGETNFEVPVEMWLNMDAIAGTDAGANDGGVQVTLQVDTIAASGTPTSNSDAVVCDES